MHTNNYVEKSLELHLFFGRIMKEHSLFLKAGFTPVNVSFSNKAEFYKSEFSKLLSCAVTLGNGVVSQQVLQSGELVTDYTALAEKQTECFTGISINKEITEREMHLRCGGMCGNNAALRSQVRNLNQTAMRLLDGLIIFKETILKNVLCCKMFTANYPLLLEHIIREARLYREYVELLEKDGCLSEERMKSAECFWNQIMMEHALFIRGLLDPTEKDLFDTANKFAGDYSELLTRCRNAHNMTLTTETLETTKKFRDFKTAGVQGIEQCKIRSVILPLLADHVLREANHYIRLLKC